uniref:G-protein coupled receptors family 1 profile domain-containing protein n=1 Tax=Parascaris univalens TaxID=6257 RepID=A0A915AVN5_PARUN
MSPVFGMHAAAESMVLSKILSIQPQLQNASLLIHQVASTTVPHLTLRQFDHSKDSVIPIVEFVLGTITYVVIILMTVIGNSLVVIAIFNYRPLKKVQNYFLVSLAASDLCVATFVMPLHVVKFLNGGRWLLGMTLCHLFTTADILLCTSSILNLCAIALDRYWAIHDPISYAQRRTLKFVCIMIALVWLASVCISVPPIIGWNDWSGENLKTHCELTTEKAFVIYSASGSFFVPLCLMIIVYLKIFLSARQRIRTNRGRSALVRISRLPPQNDGMSGSQKIGQTCRDANENIPLVVSESVSAAEYLLEKDHSSDNKAADTKAKEQLSREQPKSDRNNANGESQQLATTVLRKREKISVAKEKRAAKTVAVIIFVFSFCWLPFFCSYVILPFCTSCSLHPKVEQAFVWLGYINSSLNPFLYGILNLEFRRAFRKILCPKHALGQQRRSSRLP